jgi:hypothetical protein
MRDHLYVFHKGLGTKNWYDKLKWEIDSRVSLERQGEITELSREEKRWTRDELVEVLRLLEDRII